MVMVSAAVCASGLEGVSLQEVRGLAVEDLPCPDLHGLAARIRAFLVEKVCASGGHLGPTLGVLELTFALHRAFDTPRHASFEERRSRDTGGPGHLPVEGCASRRPARRP